jgi:hypothetical protein
MNVSIDWQQIAGASAVATFVAGIVIRLMRGGFVSTRVHERLDERVTTLERKSGDAIGKAEFAALTARVGAVETGVAVAQATLSGVSEGIKRVEHQVDLLVRHQLSKEEA